MNRLRTLSQQLWTVIRAGDAGTWSLLALIGLLGAWPGVEVWLVKRTVNFVAEGNRYQAVSALLLMIGLGIITIALFVVYPYVLKKMKDAVYRNLSFRLFGVVNRTDENDMLRSRTRDRLSNTSESITSLYAGGLDGFSFLLQTLVTAVALTGVLLATAWWAPLLILAGALCNIYLTRKAAASETSFLERNAESTRLEGALLETMTTLRYAKELRVFGLAEWLTAKWRTAYGAVAASSMRQTRRTSLIKLAGNLGGSVVTLTVLLTGLWRFREGSLRSGDVAALIVGGLHLEQLLDMVLSQGKTWLGRQVFLKPLFETASTNAEPSAPEIPDDGAVIRIRDLNFRYDGQRRALQDINLDIPQGAKLAIVGPNGSGKSTLMNLIAGVLRPEAGTLRTGAMGGFCLQDFGRYKLSVAENVFLGDIACRDRAEDVAQALADVRAGFVQELPEREDTVLWPELGGADLSEGQWQRVGLARSMFRAVYRAGSIVIMDEPTSALDPSVELEVLTSIMERLKDYTVLFVVHRLVGCSFADQVLVLDQGRVADYGPHEQLLKSSPSYKEMWEASTSFI